MPQKIQGLAQTPLKLSHFVHPKVGIPNKIKNKKPLRGKAVMNQGFSRPCLFYLLARRRPI
jgi:hypothetical protein